MRRTIFYSLVMAIFSFIPKIAVNAQSDCDIVFDFESGSGSYLGNNSATVSIEANPVATGGNASSYAMKLILGSGNNDFTMASLPIEPGDKKLSEMYKSIELDIVYNQTGTQYGKYILVGVATSAQGNYSAANSYKTASMSINGTSSGWQHFSLPVSSLPDGAQNATGSLFLGIGARDDNAGKFYYFDNIKLIAIEEACLPDLPLPEIITLPTLGSVDCGQTLADVSISGGEAQYESETVPGIFAFKNPAEKMKLSDSGITEFDLVFTPSDETAYSKVTIKVTITVNDNGACDPCNTPSGYFMIDCFEDSEINDTYGMQGSNGSATVKVDPGNASNQAIYVDPKNWDNYLAFEVTLPCSKTISDYSKIAFDINREKGNNNDFRIGFNTTLGSNAGDIRQNFSVTNGQWVHKEFDIPVTTTIDNTFTFRIGYRGSSGDAYYLDNIMLKEKEGTACPVQLTWNGSVDSDWNTKDNWDHPENTVSAIPDPSMNITIQGGLNNYPVVPASTAVKTITFRPGAEISGQQNLTGNYKAFVQYDFSDKASAHDRWYMLSVPLQEVYVGDFTFGGYPRTFIRSFNGNSGWQNSLANNNLFTPGDGFLLQIESDTYSSGAGKGLGLANGILELPYYETDATAGSGVHPNHEYASGTSTFYNYRKEEGVYVNSENSVTATRSGNAYKLAGATVSKSLDFGYDDDYSSDFALVGNPFMSTIDFDALYTANKHDGGTKERIKQNYQVWTGSGFAGYNPYGDWGVSVSSTDMDQFIAPLQSFFVEKATDNDGNSLKFDISITASATGNGKLRASGNTADKLEIVATNEAASVLTFIAKREGGSNDVAGNADACKFITEASPVPEIYTLKNSVALGANIINTDNILIPLGLSTAYSGNINLSFRGMDNYDAHIKLIDTERNTEVNLTGLNSYRYDFNYEPLVDEAGEVLPLENRFFIRFAPGALTGLNVQPETILVYSKNNTLHAVAGVSNPIKQIRIYSVQGALLYSEYVNAFSKTITLHADVPEICIVKVITEKEIKNIKVINN